MSDWKAYTAKSYVGLSKQYLYTGGADLIFYSIPSDS